MDLLSAIGNILLILLLGLLVAFNPMLIIVDIMLVLKTKRPIFNSIILIAGFATSITLLFGLASLFVDPDSQINLGRLKDNLSIPPLVDITAGLLLISYAIRRRAHDLASPKMSRPVNIIIPEKPSGLFGFGFIKAILSITNLFAILILAKMAAFNNWSPALGAVAVFIMIAIGIIPLLTIVYYRQFKHQSLKVIDQRLNALLNRDTQVLINYGLLITGLIFIFSGLWSLVR